MDLSPSHGIPRTTVSANLAVIGFLVVQDLDGVFTYLGVSIWGLNVEAKSAHQLGGRVAGLGTGLALAKLVAIGFGMRAAPAAGPSRRRDSDGVLRGCLRSFPGPRSFF